MTTTELLTFSTGGQLFALPVGDVREVLAGPSITPVPRAPSDVAGLLNLRGRVLCVLDLSTRLGLTTARRARPGVVVVEVGSELVGLAVDELLDVELLPSASPNAGWVPGRSPVVSTVDHDGQLFQIIDIKAAAGPHVGALELPEVRP